MIKELNEAKEEILLHNALDWKKFKILVAVCCSYVVSWCVCVCVCVFTCVHTYHIVYITVWIYIISLACIITVGQRSF